MDFKKKVITERIISGLLFSACFLFFYFLYDNHIYFIEQQQIFLLTPAHFLSYFSRPAFLSSYAGDFLTQFYYLVGGGPLVITALLIALWFLVRKLLSGISGKEQGLFLPLMPLIFSWIALCDIEFPLAVIISLIISVIAILIYVSLKNRRLRIASGVILIPVLYIVAGSYFFVFVIFASLFEIISGENSREKLTAGIFLLFALMIPVSLKSVYLITTGQAYTWVSESARNPGFNDFVPFISLLIAVLITLIPFSKTGFRLPPAGSIIIQTIAAVLLLISGIMVSADFNLEKILSLDYEANHNRWDRVYELSNKYRLRNNLSSYYTNMAMAKLGIMSGELMDHYQPAATGLFIPVNANENYLTITFSNEIYWQLGDVNASQHSALLGMIFSPRSRNSRLMKRLVEINIVNGEYSVARKYLTILDKTLFYREWASERKRFLYNEDECSRSKWISSKRELIPKRDLLKKGNEYKKTLEMLLAANPENRMAIDYLLCYDLLDKNIHSFVKNFRSFYRSEGKTVLPEVYQEALLIEIASGRYKPEDFAGFLFDPENVRRIAEYTTLYEQSKGIGSLLQEKFGKTYWFYYHFATMEEN